jgi:hypothetical protein
MTRYLTPPSPGSVTRGCTATREQQEARLQYLASIADPRDCFDQQFLRAQAEVCRQERVKRIHNPDRRWRSAAACAIEIDQMTDPRAIAKVCRANQDGAEYVFRGRAYRYEADQKRLDRESNPLVSTKLWD